MTYIARTSKCHDKKQTIKEHSIQTAELASSYAISPLKDIAYNCGVFHDLGKYQRSFVLKIMEKPTLKVAHAQCGAIELKNIEKDSITTKMMQYCIAGHHAGLHNFGNKCDDENQSTLCGVLKRETEDYSAYKDELKIKNLNQQEIFDFFKKDCRTYDELSDKFAFLTRYIFSCLTDADSLNSEYFEIQKERQTVKSDFIEALNILNNVLSNFKCETKLQKTRNLLQKQVFDKVNEKSDIYLMNMPTGSGKTLCSLKFALEKAVKYNKKRIIYVIPYNSIIDQMANTVEKLLGEEISVLRHQSTFNFENIEDEEERTSYKHATENWDADFIITTTVQFFESVYGNKRGKLRKMHNLADSIIIFDEAHLMPAEYLKPCLNVIAHITKNLNSEAIFLTATMPNYDKLFDGYSNIKILDLVTDKSDFDKFEKCNYTHVNFADEDELISHSLNLKSKLIVCNTKKRARDIFYKIIGEKYHLSTYMTVLDRQETIQTIRQRLEDKADITVVSTSLIEAGVDLDFETVYREMTGLDSILQAGGRCNREGYFDKGNVYIFSLPQTRVNNIKNTITNGIIKEFDNILDGIDAYYERLYLTNKIDNNFCDMKKTKIDEVYKIAFKTYAEKFKLISDNSLSIVIPNDEYSKKIVEFMKNTGIPQHKKLQKYLCNININEVNELQGVIQEYAGIYCLANLDYYDSEVGLKLTGKDYFI